MFCILENNQVILGPNHWNKRRFESCLLDDCEIEFTLPPGNDNFQPIIVSENVKICPVRETIQPSYNTKIQQLAGPFTTVNEDNSITLTYNVVDQDINSVKNDLKAIVANNRWLLEVSGVNVNVQGQDIYVTTERGSRDIFLQAVQLGSDGQRWKFDNGIWLVLSLAELQVILNAIVSHVQMAFDWESDKLAEIDACVDLASLDAVILKHQILIDKENSNRINDYVG